MSHNIFGLGWLKEGCSNSEEYKDVFERRKGTISSIGFMVESKRIDGLQCCELAIKKNVPFIRTVKYWGIKKPCGSCNKNLDVVNFFLEKEGWTGWPLKFLPAFFQGACSGYHSCQFIPDFLNLVWIIFYPCSAKVSEHHVVDQSNALTSKQIIFYM